MMMAYDSGPGAGALDPATIDVVRSALTAYVTAAQPGDELPHALRRMSEEARAKAILPEQVLVVLKEIWYSLPIIHQTEPSEQMRLLQRIVTMCIKEYYLTQSSS